MKLVILTPAQMDTVKLSDFHLKQSIELTKQEIADFKEEPIAKEEILGGEFTKAVKNTVLSAMETTIDMAHQILAYRDQTKTNVPPMLDELEEVEFIKSGASFEDVDL